MPDEGLARFWIACEASARSSFVPSSPRGVSVFGRRTGRRSVIPLVGLVAGVLVGTVALAAPASAATPLALNSGWQTFYFRDAGSGASGQPYVFTAAFNDVTLKVTDGSNSGDQFAVYDNGILVGQTDAVPTGGYCSNPDSCYASSDMSHGIFTLPPGAHSITIVAIASPYGTGGAYLRVDLGAILCTTTITGTHAALTVPSGLTCLSHATITGGITVAKGAGLDVESSTVQGGIAAHGAGLLQVCGSKTGSINASGASGATIIGDPADGCAANKISGGLVAANNTGGGTIVNNAISGSWTITNNTPAFTVSGNHH